MRINYKHILPVVIVLATCAVFQSQAQAREGSAKKPYEIISDARVKFDKDTAKMSDAEKQYLYDLFYIADLAFRERMIMLDFFRKRQDIAYIDRYNVSIDELLKGFKIIEAPNVDLGKVEMHIVNALKDQRRFFNEWHEAWGTKKYDQLQENFTTHPHVRNNHSRLVKAHNILKENYRRESKENLQAFSDHIRALDFI